MSIARTRARLALAASALIALTVFAPATSASAASSYTIGIFNNCGTNATYKVYVSYQSGAIAGGTLSPNKRSNITATKGFTYTVIGPKTTRISVPDVPTPTITAMAYLC